MLKLFPPPMDRAEVLHKPSHAYKIWWKIIPVQNELVNREHFRKPWQNIIHCSRQATFQICPLCHSITLRAQRKSVSTSHFWISVGGDSRQRNEFAILSTISSQERRVFSKFHGSHVPRLHPGKPWASSIFFLRLWIELTFCINLAMHMLFDGKLFLSKTNWSIQSIFNSSHKIQYIVHGRRPSKFARCAIVLLFELNGNPSLRVTSGFSWGRFASAKRICWFWCPSSLENAVFH